ncbi:LysM peptidoglycan-binding domain-containing protein [Candidatus Poribacteria bacterium]|jgi:LysM repeat protein|nr:LysM peptidoglycan-binding domain-containing protein [Candidatus Poribacteria bacterium]MBT5537251.1 LysM peptidoglycan-binding domain-containing protein [Candidatus Poribacteria bacterium]MBT5713209.1 LysM peptidoglycan-binding domain-containing protein [Candidatus Poribacteria bacterium]MBT7100407.1 LysM peptidoglycan-binding domain-containing protein [Candidatus Poribacteria bacterium]MBT7807490.1 LysM peptidoglycan-binding domain-containing protein [Candidatus Poribacteria bacterium]
MPRRRVDHRSFERASSAYRRADWNRSPATHGARYPLRQPTHRRVIRRLVRSIPIVVILLFAWRIGATFLQSREQRMWYACEKVYEERQADRVDTIEEFRALYPESAHAADAAYYYAVLAHDAKGCAAVDEAWQVTLTRGTPERKLEAVMSLGECANKAGDAALAVDYYGQALELNLATQGTVEAVYRAGALSEQQGDVTNAIAYYRAVWELPEATRKQRIDVARGLTRIQLGALSANPPRHVVRRDETLWSIANKAGVAMRDLLRANLDLANPNVVEVGVTLNIPIRDISLVVSVAGRMIYLLHEGAVVCPFPVVLGADDTPTPEGNLSVVSKEFARARLISIADSVVGGPAGLGAGWFGLSRVGYGIHGGSTEEELLEGSTHGAIRLVDSAIESLGDFVTPGTPVTIVAEAPEIEWKALPVDLR